MAASAHKQKRRYERATITVEDLSARFQLKFQQRCFESVKVVDVSPNGAGLALHEPLAIDLPVTLTLMAGEWHLALDAMVVWCRNMAMAGEKPAQPGHYRVGLRFNPTNTHNNVLFYMAARALTEPTEMTAPAE